MKISYITLAQVANVVDFPAIAESLGQGQLQNEKHQGVPDLTPTFDLKLHYVSNTGGYAFKALDFAAGDVRASFLRVNAVG